MKKTKLIHAGTLSIVAMCLLLTIHFSCEENQAEESPVAVTTQPAVVNGLSSTTSGLTSIWNKQVGGAISKDQAVAWVENYVKEHPGAVRSRFFGKDLILKMLSNEKAVGINIQLGQSSDGQLQLLLSALDGNGNQLTTDDILFGDRSTLCPPDCPTLPILDSN